MAHFKGEEMGTQKSRDSRSHWAFRAEPGYCLLGRDYAVQTQIHAPDGTCPGSYDFRSQS